MSGFISYAYQVLIHSRTEAFVTKTENVVPPCVKPESKPLVSGEQGLSKLDSVTECGASLLSR